MRSQHARRFTLLSILTLTLACGNLFAQNPQTGSAASASVPAQSAILTPAEAEKILPATVFFRGQSAPVQGRNSGGVRLSDHSLILIALVDNSGYSSQIQQKYQAYFITEAALDIGGHTLPPGAYGCGFIANDTFILMDIGGHDLFTAHSTRDTALSRPRPLAILPAPGNQGYRLYAGRSYITLRAASGS